MTDLTPTDEQVAAVRAAMTGDHLAIEAGAGCAKSTTLRLIAEAKHAAGVRHGVYVAFNRRVVEDASGVFPRSVRAATAHGLAMRAVGRDYRHRVGAPRMKSADIARRAGIDAVTVQTPFGPKLLPAGFLAGILMRGIANFCQSDDDEPAYHHIPVPETMRHDVTLRLAWGHVRRHLEGPLRVAWADMLNPDGVLPYSHDAYLKTWSLGRPNLHADYLLADESQDLWPAWLAVMEANRDRTQLVVVGDANQQLYEWRSAVNAMRETEVVHRSTLSTSFRFGPEIAAIANDCLARIHSTLRLIGGGRPGRVGTVDFPDLVLCRTNAHTVRHALEEFDDGGAPHIIGGATEVVAFARGARDLQDGRRTYHPDLACFTSWGEVMEYVVGDELGGELALLVKLVEDYTPDRIITAFDGMPPRNRATLVVSTVHKMKGGEANAVRLGDDFPEDDEEHPVGPEEHRVIYVAVTRARRELDINAVDAIRSPLRMA